MSSTLCLNDDDFGPSVSGCRGDLDFTQKFERIVLSIIPASVFFALALTRVAVLVQRPRIVAGDLFKYCKLLALGTYAAIQLSLLALLAAGKSDAIHSLSIAAAALVFVTSLTSIPLSFLEHGNAVKPSALLGSYLSLTILFDIVQARTAWLTIVNARHTSIAGLFSASIGIKLIIVCLEAVPKVRWTDWIPSEHSPEESMNMFTHGLWSWLNPLLLKGNRTILDIDALYPLDTRMKAEMMHDKLNKHIRYEKCRDDPKFGLFKDLSKTLTGPFLLPIAPRLALIGFKFCQPLLFQTTLVYLSEDQASRRENIGYALIGAAFFTYTMLAISGGFFKYWNLKALYQTRGCLCSAIYRKTVTAKLTAADDSAALTLMSTDIERIVLGGEHVHEVWAAVVEVAIGLWLLQSQVGAAFVAPVVTILVCSALTFGVSKHIGGRQKAWMTAIQHRVGLTANAIANMKLFKMSGMAATVADRIQGLRVDELEVGKRLRWLMVACTFLGYAPYTLVPTFTFAVTSRDLDVSTIFTSLAYILLVTTPLTVLFQVFPQVLSALACLQRIQKFLVSDSQVDYRLSSYTTKSMDEGQQSDSSTYEKVAFTVENGSAGWTPDSMTLKNINVKIPAGELTLVVGPVASGKTTFCTALLGEMPFVSGSVSLHFPPQSIGYCPQVPFLYNASLKANVIGQSEFEQTRFNEVIHATLLSTDIDLLPQGSDTIIGSNGISLSGGQRQRVSVARALYSGSNILIFDDVLSGLDSDTDAELFRRVFGPSGLLRRRHATSVVCTHSISHLPEADHIIAFDSGGSVIEQGTFEDLASNQSYIQSLNVQKAKPQASVEKAGEPANVSRTDQSPKQVASKHQLEDKARRTGDWSVYAYYFSNVSPLATTVLAIAATLHGFLEHFSTVWLTYWSTGAFGDSNAFYVGILALLRVSDLVILTTGLAMVMIVMATFAGSKLHLAAIMTVATAPLSFFTSTDTGTVTNLFSQDMTLIDNGLLYAVTNFTFNMPEALGAACVIAVATPYLAIGYPILIGLIYYLQRFYLRTSRQLRLLDLEAKSPLYTNFIDTMKGIATIRAYRWESRLIEKSDLLLDTSQRPAYLLTMIQQWLAVVMELMVAALAVVLFSMATQLDASAGLTGASLLTLLNFGLILYQLIRSYTQLETCIGAVNRLRAFSATVKPEDQPHEDVEPPISWPHDGLIDVRDVSATYSSTEPVVEKAIGEAGLPSDCVLRNVNLTIEPGQKVALCGRSGSGKSSLLLLFLRLLEPLPSCADNIQIDGLSLRSIRRSSLRERIIAIPQDAVFLPEGSTIRENIDPQRFATIEECMSVLQSVRLSGFVDDRGGLDAGMGPEDLSAGQKQLFSLGRAILRKRIRARLLGANAARGILMLDEVSSNVDRETDRAMQEIIKVEFAAYTIVMVSHRLEMVVDFFDRVVLLDKGAVVETGSPTDLIQTPGSRFGELWAISNCGKASSTNSSETQSLNK